MIERLALQIVSLPLTIEGLNAGRFSPKSEYENLQAGLLQLVDGTSLLIDETSLTEGTLNDTGNFVLLHRMTWRLIHISRRSKCPGTQQCYPEPKPEI